MKSVKLTGFNLDFELVVKTELKTQPKPKLYYDLELKLSDISDPFIKELESIAPYGKDFEPPSFLFNVKLMAIKYSSCDKHIFLTMASDQVQRKFIEFNISDKYPDDFFNIGDSYKVIAKPSSSLFNGKSYIDLHIQNISLVRELVDA